MSGPEATATKTERQNGSAKSQLQTASASQPQDLWQSVRVLLELGRWHNTESRLQCYGAAWAFCLAFTERLATHEALTRAGLILLASRFVYGLVAIWVCFTCCHAAFCVHK